MSGFSVAAGLKSGQLNRERNCAKPAFRKITLLVSYSCSSSCSSSKLLSRFQYRGRARGRARGRFKYPVLGLI
ncbi:hypothetical protein D1AOALGA4SA_8963 [Olavius algarvensis Delta 1 endosymbiont]|nr:hypothetical protein D1AOALGA4SA_8963 [Olavius algarvensis Delta 1 endosymbiont]